MRARLLIPDAGEPFGEGLRTLDARQSHHLVRVLRLGPGAAIECFDGTGSRFEARIERADARACTVRVGTRLVSQTESPLHITLAQCVSSAERMDWTIEKAVELGAHTIRPLISARSPVRLDPERTRRRHEHWSRIVEAACMQCGRDRLPELHEAVAFETWLGSREQRSDAPGTALVLLPDAALRIRDFPVDTAQEIEMLVGPESGFGEREIAQALAAGFTGVRVGPRTLRTETAALAALAALQAIAGDF